MLTRSRSRHSCHQPRMTPRAFLSTVGLVARVTTLGVRSATSQTVRGDPTISPRLKKRMVATVSLWLGSPSASCVHVSQC